MGWEMDSTDELIEGENRAAAWTLGEAERVLDKRARLTARMFAEMTRPGQASDPSADERLAKLEAEVAALYTELGMRREGR